MKINFIPIDYDSFDFEGKNYMKIFGRDDNGKRICIIDTCDVYLWAILKDNLSERKINLLTKKIEKIELNVKGRATKVEKIELHEKNFLGRKVKALKVFATNYKDLHDIANFIDMEEIEKRRGYDVGFTTHYIIEKKLKPLNWYEINCEIIDNTNEFGGIASGFNEKVSMCVKLNSQKDISEKLNKKFEPKILAYDIETDEIKIGQGEILMVSLVSNSKNFKKVITWKKPQAKIPDYVEFVEDEKELIEKFIEYVNEISPDFLIGYFSDGFDLPYFKARAEKFKIKLSLGLDESQPRFTKSSIDGLFTGRIKGIVHIDLLKFIRTTYSQYMQSETLSLNEVSKEFLGDEKVSFEWKHHSKLNSEEWEKFFEYNLHDSLLASRLFEKFWPDLIEFTKVIQEPIFETSRNGMSKNVEAYILHNLEKFNEIPEKKPGHLEIGQRKSMEKYEGAFVLEPNPGIYDDLVMFDFTSSYGSVIVTYNLSKSTFVENISKFEEKKFYSVTSGDKKLFFKKELGFFPEMMKEVIQKRKQFKKELKDSKDLSEIEFILKRARSNAFKLLANAAYGYQGFFGARYYCREAAAATAAFAKKSILDAIKEINKSGYTTIYSDTDSIAFLSNGKTQTQTKDFLKKLNSQLPGIMELEIEGFFKRGIWVTTRAGNVGAKKKYALIDNNNKLKIRGFETVRRDWCRLTRNLQNQVIKFVLEDGNEKRALDYVKKIIKKVKNREVEKEDLIIKTQLKKSILDYKAITPHVIAARKMKEAKIPIGEGNLIEYYIAEIPNKKTKLVREKVKLPEEKGNYDVEYYLNRQILPAVENIFHVFKVNAQELIDGKKQKTLGDF